MKIACGTDESDCRVQLLIAEPPLMLFPALKPRPAHHPTGTNQRADQHGQEVRHGSQGNHESAPHHVEVASLTRCLEDAAQLSDVVA